MKVVFILLLTFASAFAQSELNRFNSMDVGSFLTKVKESPKGIEIHQTEAKLKKYNQNIKSVGQPLFENIYNTANNEEYRLKLDDNISLLLQLNLICSNDVLRKLEKNNSNRLSKDKVAVYASILNCSSFIRELQREIGKFRRSNESFLTKFNYYEQVKDFARSPASLISTIDRDGIFYLAFLTENEQNEEQLTNQASGTP